MQPQFPAMRLSNAELVELIIGQQREVKRLEVAFKEVDSKARSVKREWREASAKLKAMLEETAEEAEVEPAVPAAADPPTPSEPVMEWHEPNEHGVFPSAEIIRIDLPKTSKCTAEILLVRRQAGYYLASAEYRHKLGFGGGLPSENGTRYLTRADAIADQCRRLITLFEREGEQRAVNAIGAYLAEVEREEPEPERCPDCGGYLDFPTPRRKPRSKKACHLLKPGGKARAMKVPPEEVREKRENPPELVEVAESAPRDESWRTVAIADLGLDYSIVDVLMQLGWTTAGDLDRFLWGLDGDDQPIPFEWEDFVEDYSGNPIGEIRAALEAVRPHTDAQVDEEKPELHWYMVYHALEQPEGPLHLYRICLIQIGGDLLTAAAFARKRVGWQVEQFSGEIHVRARGPGYLCIAQGGKWLAQPREGQHEGALVRGELKDQVPDVCPSKPEPEPTDWRNTPIHGIGLPHEYAETLFACEIETAGAAAELLEPGDHYELASLSPLHRERLEASLRECLTKLRPETDPQPEAPKAKCRKPKGPMELLMPGGGAR